MRLSLSLFKPQSFTAAVPRPTKIAVDHYIYRPRGKPRHKVDSLKASYQLLTSAEPNLDHVSTVLSHAAAAPLPAATAVLTSHRLAPSRSPSPNTMAASPVPARHRHEHIYTLRECGRGGSILSQ
ncbi:hypothetical protein E2C01_031431 [Portunus trituberculatus]|uniref:Uncharacterized protein n=1 Tax=Portunus trituberculatus TaxID=210409 RepID=A0A5B7EXL3_PORTR|nr:hypothetical protein [Portunus trituberculatus]